MKFARGGVDLKSYLTVTEILTRKHFVNCEVIAGEKGLANSVKWVHVMEVTRINELLKGNELILSTGVGWGEDPQSCLSFLKSVFAKTIPMALFLLWIVFSLPAKSMP